MLSKIYNCYRDLNTIGQLIVLISIALIIIELSNMATKYKLTKEGMTSSSSPQFVMKEGPDIYDNFYASVYDYLMFSKVKNDFEIEQITSATHMNDESVIIDIGSGLGHHVNALHERGINVIGIDNSQAMVNEAKSLYPQCTFRKDDGLNSDLLQSDTISHILCLYFTIYYFQDKTLFFSNCFQWLQSGGYLVIHLVNKHLFDPILPAGNPLNILSLQKYAPKRITNTKITFNEFIYTSEFMFDDDDETIASFNEKFKFNDGKVRKTRHPLFMEDMNTITQMAQHCGFVLIKKIDLMQCAYENQYLYVLQKPN